MTWKLIREAGIQYASMPEARRSERLCLPSYAARAPDGTYVIAEGLGVEKMVPFRFECRTLRVDADHHTLFDSTAIGIDDGFGCLMGDGSIAIVRRTHWELLIVSPQHQIVDKLNLSAFSKKIPRYATWTDRGTFLIVFLNRSFDQDIVEVDREGRLLWHLPSSVSDIGIASSVQRLANDRLLIADSFRHRVTEIDREGNVLWQFGEAGHPSGHPHRLSSPNSAKCLSDGERLVADTRNHRVLSVTPEGQAHSIVLPDSGLCDPTFADELADGHRLICDTGNGRILELDQQGGIVWEYGDTIARRRHLSYPRSVDLVGPERYLIADTGNNRIVEISEDKVETKQFSPDFELFWPRCVRRLPTGSFLIADARNGRIVELNHEGSVVNELRQVKLDRQRTLQDPHDVRLLPNGHLLVSDSPQDLIFEVDWSGTVHRTIGNENGAKLKDPHSAQQLDDGSVVISDTGNHRVLIAGPDGRCVRSISSVQREETLLRLHLPRYAEVSEDGTLVIVDTGQNRIIGCTLSGTFLWEFSDVPESRTRYLNQPRWARLVGDNEIIVCDHFHHRILHAKWSRNRRSAG